MMIGPVLLFVVSLAVGLLLCTRLYQLVARGELNVKGVVYSRTSTPIAYWVLLTCILGGTIMVIGMGMVMGIGLATGMI